jgi:hypothetical protein
MWINASQTGKRIDDLRADFKELRNEVKDLRIELTAFKFEIAKPMDRPN